ncbi:DUF4381 domain-containing protein [Vibrio pectenicida]|uniref:DUF4381 domain-containing protein n=1 Tax=Vibrio pectenicida TaxID=62763 RepID=A0A427U0H6_9VIBR|nr:DUF4381 domain-containing protein [Vibrio pectenicida]RSD30070.1 DUF4381 domain-containing protein [Vibrio pectenicida]
MTELHKPPSTYILRQLHDVVVPDSVSWLPQTIGWKVLAVFGFALLAYGLYCKAWQWWVNRYRSEAIQAISRLKPSDADQPQELFSILKIVLIYLDNANAPLFDEQFLQKLDALNPNSVQFTDEVGKRWVKSVFDPNIVLDASECLLLNQRAMEWVKRHDNRQVKPVLKKHLRRLIGGRYE